MAAQPLHVVDTRQCAGCGAVIEGKRSKQHCSAKCRATVARTRRQQRMQALLRTVKEAVAELEDLVGKE